MATIATITLTHNEEHNIERCLRALQWCDERIVVDTFSTDRTLEIARPLATKIIRAKMSDFSTVRNDGINAAAAADWVFIVDADEEIPAELANEITDELRDTDMDGFILNRINHLYGVRLKAFQPDHTPRLFRKGKGLYTGSVHERLVIDGKVGHLKTPFLHYSSPTPEDYSRKLDLYTSLETEGKREPDAALLAKPFYKFLQIYFMKKAYKDGMLGIILSLNAFYYEFIKLFKIWEKRYLKRENL